MNNHTKVFPVCEYVPNANVFPELIHPPNVIRVECRSAFSCRAELIALTANAIRSKCHYIVRVTEVLVDKQKRGKMSASPTLVHRDKPQHSSWP